MKRIQFASGKHLSRRLFLRGTGVAMALPWLDAMVPAFAKAGTAAAASSPRRFVAVSLPLGLHGPNLVPEKSGRDYKPSLYLKELAGLEKNFTVISGASHPGVGGGHRAEACILTAAPLTGESGFRNSVSLDQYMARRLGEQTRFPSLILNSSGSSSTSYTENGAMIPAERSPSRLFARLFVEDSPTTHAQYVQRLREGRSIMDVVGADAKRLSGELGAGDRDKLDRYFTGVRELEHRLASSEEWTNKPKPKVAVKPVLDIADANDLVGRERAMLDVIHLALQTDSTRFITLHGAGGNEVLPIDGVSQGYHNLSHHGQDPEKLDQLALVEAALIRAWGEFLKKLNTSAETSGNLLDNTMVLLTSNLGNASAHDNKNMPVLFAGGGFKHGQHLAFDQSKNYPLPNLYLSMLQRLGLESDKFATSTGTMKGLEMA